MEASSWPISSFDFFIFSLAIVVITVLPTLWRTKRQDSPLNFLLLGRRITLPLFVASLVSTWYGGLFGVTRIAFEQGIYNFVTQGVFWYVAYLLFVFFVVDRVFAHKEATSMAELVGRIFGRKAAVVCAIFNVLDVIPVVYVVSLGYFLSVILDVDPWWSMVVTTLLVATYTARGGFRAIVLSDCFQFLAMFASLAAVTWFSVSTLGSPSWLFRHLPPSHLDPTGGESILQLTVWGGIALTTLVNPNFYHRCLVCSTPSQAKKGILISIVFWVVIDTMTTLGGLYARVSFPEADPANAFLQHALAVLPDGWRGFFCAGVVACIVSTVDSYLFIGGQTLSRDLLGSKSVGAMRMAIFVVATLALLLAFHFDGHVKAIWKFLGSLAASGLFIPMTFALFSKQTDRETTFLWSCAIACLGVLGSQAFFPNHGVDALYVGILCNVGVWTLSPAWKAIWSIR